MPAGAALGTSCEPLVLRELPEGAEVHVVYQYEGCFGASHGGDFLVFTFHLSGEALRARISRVRELDGLVDRFRKWGRGGASKTSVVVVLLGQPIANTVQSFVDGKNECRLVNHARLGW